MWINHATVTLFYECGSIMSTSHCSMNVDQSCQRHIEGEVCDVRCDEKTISSKTYQRYNVYREFGNVAKETSL